MCRSLAALTLAVSLFASGCGGDSDDRGYTKERLDQMFRDCRGAMAKEGFPQSQCDSLLPCFTEELTYYEYEELFGTPLEELPTDWSSELDYKCWVDHHGT